MLRGRSLGKARRLSFLFSLIAIVTFVVAPAVAAKRVALVIGNADYRNVAHLDNPANDAKLMAKTLRDLGFTLVGGDAELDLDKPHFDAALQDFSNQVLGAEVALFYYAGHGVQVSDRNFLVPVEANPTKESDVYLQMVDTSIVLTQMEDSGAKLKIVLLDACRNNPFAGRGFRATGGGLAQMQAPEGTLISYATQPGAVALDGGDGDSPYSKALAQAIRKPGVGLFDTFNDIGLAVKRATGGQQQPWLASSPIEGGFYFSGNPPTVAIASAEPAAANPSGASKRTADPAATTPRTETPAPFAKPSPPQQTAALTPNEPAPGANAESPVATCDRLASSPLDPNRPPGIDGVEYEDIVAAPAIAACRAAMAAEPRNVRLWFELARSEMKAGGADDEAINLLRKASADGHAGAMNALGLAYERGVGVRKDMGEAARWYQRSAEAGNSAAMHRLGLAFKNGDGVQRNWMQALRWFRKSADAGNPIGMAELGRAYADGWGTAPNPVEAAKWFRKAADAGNPAGMNQLGMAYLRGFGVDRDPAEAVRWFHKSADAGNLVAMENLGRAYRNGVGVHRDDDEAKRWFDKARR
jgi:TPR repeat protein